MPTPEFSNAGAPPRALLVGSSGGHLTQLLALEPWWRDIEHGWVTFDTPDAMHALRDEEHVWWAHHPTTRNLPNLVRNGRLARRVVAAFRPTIVVSTGAAVALPFFVAARQRGIRTVYVEVYDRIKTPTLTGRLCRPVADLMLVQWPEQVPLYDDALPIGPLL